MHRRLALVTLAVLLAGCLGRADPAELPFSEDFSGSCTWPTRWEGVKRGECADGVYRFELTEPGGPYTSWRELEGSHAAIEVEVTADIEDAGADAWQDGFAVGCWSEVRGSGYLFAVSGEGRVAVYAEDESGMRPVLDETPPHPKFKLPADLRATCIGGPSRTTLRFAVNGAEIGVPDPIRIDETFTVVGFAARTNGAESTILFDDFAASVPQH